MHCGRMLCVPMHLISSGRVSPALRTCPLLTTVRMTWRGPPTLSSLAVAPLHPVRRPVMPEVGFTPCSQIEPISSTKSDRVRRRGPDHQPRRRGQRVRGHGAAQAGRRGAQRHPDAQPPGAYCCCAPHHHSPRADAPPLFAARTEQSAIRVLADAYLGLFSALRGHAAATRKPDPSELHSVREAGAQEAGRVRATRLPPAPAATQ